MNKEVATPFFYMAKKKVTFILMPILPSYQQGLCCPHWNFFRFLDLCVTCSGQKSLMFLPCSGFLFALHFSSSCSIDTASAMLLCRDWPCVNATVGSRMLTLVPTITFITKEGLVQLPSSHSAWLSITYNRPMKKRVFNFSGSQLPVSYTQLK